MWYYIVTGGDNPINYLEARKMKFIVEKVANMVFITSNCGTVFNAWDECEFTERKLNNAMRKIEKNYCGNVSFERKF